MPRQRPRTIEPAAWASLATLGVAVVAAPMLIGGAPGWSVPIIALLGALSASVATVVAWRQGRSMPVGLALATLTLGALYTAIQAVPLPCELTALLAPDATEHARLTAELFHQEVRCTITQDPGRTREEVLKGLTLLSFFVAATLAARTTRREHVFSLVVLTSVLVGAVMLAHMIVDAESIWGLYQPRFGTAKYGPFVNPNHIGGVFVLGAPLALGVGLSSEEQARRTPWLVACVFLLACTAVTLSRGAIGAGIAGMAFFGVLTARREAKKVRTSARSPLQRLLVRPESVALFAAVGASVVVGFAAGIERIQREFEGGDLSKTDLAWRGFEMAITGPWLGVGRGAFAVAFVPHAPETGVRFDYAENAIAQWTADWGIAFGSLMLGLVALLVIRILRQAERSAMVGASAALVAYGAQNLVDFGSELLGSAVLAVVVLAAASTGEQRARSDARSRRWGLGTALTVALLSFVGIGWFGVSTHERRVEVAQADLEEAMREGRRDDFERAVARVAMDHPREPIFPLLSGAEAAHHREPRALAALNRAILIAPFWASPHILSARLLATLGHRDQALVEARAALSLDPSRASGPACEILRAAPSAAALLRLLPQDEPSHTVALTRLASCVPENDPHADEIDRALVALHPNFDTPRVRLARRELRAGRTEHALGWLVLAERYSTPAVALARAEITLARGDAQGAIELAERAERSGGDPWAAVALRARAHARLERWTEMRDTIGELRGIAGADPRRLGEAEVLLGSLERQAGHRGQALAAYERAWRSFDRLDALVAVAQLAHELGDAERERGARRTLCERNRTDFCDSEP